MSSMVGLRKTSIIIPTYNEKDNIRPSVEAIFSLNIGNLEVIIVDDNSPDKTGRIADELIKEYNNLKVIHRQEKQSLDRAYLDVFNRIIQGEIPSDFIITMDADLSHPVKKIPEIIKTLNQGYDLVIGSRYIKGGSTQGWNFRRSFLSRNANRYTKIITGVPINDLTTGFVGYNVETLRKIDLSQIQSDGYAFHIEMKYRMIDAGAHFLEIPISFVERQQGRSKFNKSILGEAVFVPWRLKSKKIMKLNQIHNSVPVDYYEKGIENNLFQKYWHSKRLFYTNELLSPLDVKNFLDLGCHSGLFTHQIKSITKAKGSAIDISYQAIQYAKQKYPDINFLCRDIQKKCPLRIKVLI